MEESIGILFIFEAFIDMVVGVSSQGIAEDQREESFSI